MKITIVSLVALNGPTVVRLFAVTRISTSLYFGVQTQISKIWSVRPFSIIPYRYIGLRTKMPTYDFIPPLFEVVSKLST